MKIATLGVSGAGKSCYLYAMSQVMRIGATNDDFTLQIRVKNDNVQRELEEGFSTMVDKRKWPDTTDVSLNKDGKITLKNYHFRVAFDDDGKTIGYNDYLIPDLHLIDYKGGALTLSDYDSLKQREKIFETFSDASAIVVFIDGSTLLYAMDSQDRHPIHREMGNNSVEVLRKQNEILYIENILDNYKEKRLIELNNQLKDDHQVQPLPPVLVAISKCDLFADESEHQKARIFLKRNLRSIFARGSNTDAGITSFSLGDQLGTDDEGYIIGELCTNISHNIHIPIVYGIYAYFSTGFDGFTPDERKEAYVLMAKLQEMMRGKVEMIINGYPAFEVL